MRDLLLITLIPVVFATVGGALAVYRVPGASVTSAVQHFAAGVVFAAAAGELMPDLVHRAALMSTTIGGACGIGLMLAVKAIAGRARGERSLLAVTAFDIFIDGVILGIGFAAGQKEGVLLTIALTVEILFLGVSIAVNLRNAKGTPGRSIAITGGVALLLPVGAAIGLPVATGAAELVNGLFSFALMALLYLVTEELLVEAHKLEERPWITSTFFAGFLFLLLAEEWMAKGA